MPTLQNTRPHDLTACGVTLKPGLNEVSDDDLGKLRRDAQFLLWFGVTPAAGGGYLKWVSLVQFSPEQHAALKAKAKAATEAAAAASKEAAASTAASAEGVSAAQRAALLDAEVEAGKTRGVGAAATDPAPKADHAGAPAKTEPEASGKKK
jgi:hypothetical protein